MIASVCLTRLAQPAMQDVLGLCASDSLTRHIYATACLEHSYILSTSGSTRDKSAYFNETLLLLGAEQSERDHTNRDL